MNETQEYRLRWRGRETGPFPLEEINRLLDDHEIGLSHEIYCEDKWISLEEFLAPPKPAPASSARIKVALPSAPEIPAVRGPAATSGPAPRRRLLFALLALLAGFAGAHNFYARQWLTGLLQLLLSVATFLMGFGIIASWLWAMAEAIFVRHDGNGVEMN